MAERHAQARRPRPDGRPPHRGAVRIAGEINPTVGEDGTTHWTFNDSSSYTFRRGVDKGMGYRPVVGDFGQWLEHFAPDAQHVTGKHLAAVRDYLLRSGGNLYGAEFVRYNGHPV